MFNASSGISMAYEICGADAIFTINICFSGGQVLLRCSVNDVSLIMSLFYNMVSNPRFRRRVF